MTNKLLSAVLDADISDHSTKGKDVELWSDSSGRSMRSRINVYELMHLMKQWAFVQGYIIESDITGWYRVSKDECYIGVDGTTTTEPEAVTLACEFIFKETT